MTTSLKLWGAVDPLPSTDANIPQRPIRDDFLELAGTPSAWAGPPCFRTVFTMSEGHLWRARSRGSMKALERLAPGGTSPVRGSGSGKFALSSFAAPRTTRRDALDYWKSS